MTRYLAFLMLIVITATSGAQEKYIDKFDQKELYLSGETLFYNFYEPEKAQKGQSYPVIIALHGGENQGASREDFLKRAGAIAWGWTTPLVQEKYPSYVIAPHFTVVDGPENLIRGWLGALNPLKYIIDSLVSTGKVDPNRIYVAGHSFGGGFTWMYPLELEDYFAAILPTSWALEPSVDENVLEVYEKTPVWAIQHKDDGTEDSNQRRRDFLLELRDDFVKTDVFGDEEILLSDQQINNEILSHSKYFYTEYEYLCGDQGQLDCHFAMDSVIADTLVHKWLFQQYKQDPGAISIELLKDDENLSISWKAKNNTDKISIWIKPEDKGNWQLIHTSSGTIKKHSVALSSLPKTDKLLVRTLIKNGDGFVYGQDEKSIFMSDDTPLGLAKHPIEVYPNPVLNTLRLRGDIGMNASLQIYSSTGIKVLTAKHSLKTRNGEWNVDVSALPRGVYILIVGTSSYTFYKDN